MADVKTHTMTTQNTNHDLTLCENMYHTDVISVDDVKHVLCGVRLSIVERNFIKQRREKSRMICSLCLLGILNGVYAIDMHTHTHTHTQRERQTDRQTDRQNM